MKALILEFSVVPRSIALFDGSVCLSAAALDDAADRLAGGDAIHAIRKTFDQSTFPLEALEGVVVGLGPGSFAGIRTALALAQGLCLPDALPILGVNSAAAMAEAHGRSSRSGTVTVIGDARRGHLWIGRFGTGNRLHHDERDFQLLSWTALIDAVEPGEGVLTPDWSRIGETLVRRLPQARVNRDARPPSAEAIGNWLIHHPGEARLDPLPIYLFAAVRSK